MDTESYESPVTAALEEALAHLLGLQHDNALHLAHIRQTLIALHQAEQRREKVRRHRARARTHKGGDLATNEIAA